jgi:20S proteasome subunit beta 3
LVVQSILQYNGAAVVAMAGKNCVCIGSDTRLGVQGQTVACDFKKVFEIHPKLYIGLAGLASDVQTL